MYLEQIKELRSQTHLSMALCKKALEETQGNVIKAVEYLQKQNSLKTIDSQVEVCEGLVKAKVIDGIGKITEVKCQTDFCARSELFATFIDNFLTEGVGLSSKRCDPSSYLSEWSDKYEYTKLCKQLGEKIVIRRSDTLWIDNLSVDADPSLTVGVCRDYNHHSGKIAVLLGALFEEEHKDNPKLLSFLDEVAMQIAATNPQFLTIDAPLPATQPDITTTGNYASQKAIFEEQAASKPEKMREKIVAGKMASWYGEVVLLKQESLLHPKKTIQMLQRELQQELDSKFVLVDFIRYELGA